ncbi:DUF6907 domain-containing protein [Nonomuraea lactucae]|uniref:DUF6907 domain-containing protein n=1 Tax=Nonomuraea lactucae TaxID=2249762 RepID=UPI000DE435AC|nr:hypothetical protein [Nonomuraea lactucae]
MNSTTPTPEPARPELPPTVRERAEKAGRDAKLAFEVQYRAELAAYKNEAAARGTSDAHVVTWLQEDPCDDWCVGDPDHRAGTHPDDRVHIGPTLAVSLVTMEPVAVDYPSRWAPPEVTVSLERLYREKEPRIAIGAGDDTHMYATLAEAEQLASKLVEAVRAARGWTSPGSGLFDPDGRCPDVACRHCYPIAGEVSA